MPTKNSTPSMTESEVVAYASAHPETTSNVLSISGGKDSTALWLLALERDVKFTAVFADTGHEHSKTYRYLDYLQDKLGPIRFVRADFSRRIEVRRKNLREVWGKDGIPEARIEQALELLHPTGIPFLDLCMLKGRFPSTRARFCSQELKQIPIRQQVIEPLLDQGMTVVSWQGVRAQESASRASLPIADMPEENLVNYRPILSWTHDQVFDQHRKHGVKWNPLYESGMGRVGCMPCIHCRKSELRQIQNRFPSELQRVAEWEAQVVAVSKEGRSTFFAHDKTPGLTEAGGGGIADIAMWAQTGKGGRNFDLLFDEDAESCSSLYGLCE